MILIDQTCGSIENSFLEKKKSLLWSVLALIFKQLHMVTFKNAKTWILHATKIASVTAA